MSTLACAGCGAPLDDSVDPYPFRCPRAAELPDADHVVRRTIDTACARIAIEHHENPFLRYRQFLHSYHLARRHGMSDAAYVDLVTRLNDGVARADLVHLVDVTEDRGFAITPLRTHDDLDVQLGIEPPGTVWVKDETGNVSGSHKARHLMGVMLHLLVIEALGIDQPRRRGLAIASCGNAALAAAVVARAAGYSLRVFVPATADPAVIERIEQLGARVEICARQPGVRGDPSYLRFRQAVIAGALPFCCQGSENGLTIEGGETLGFEIVEALGDAQPDRVLVQVGGGALASSCIQAFTDMRVVNGGTPPRFHAVQTCGAFPLKRAFDRVHERHLQAAAAAAALRRDESIDGTMRYARTHRSAFMQAWDVEPHSVAHGILDDETYDWAAVVEGMLRSGGSPIVVSEDELERANRVARAATGIDVDHTGSAGLAGLMQLVERDPAARRDTAVVIFSGIRRSSA